MRVREITDTSIQRRNLVKIIRVVFEVNSTISVLVIKQRGWADQIATIFGAAIKEHFRRVDRWNISIASISG